MINKDKMIHCTY